MTLTFKRTVLSLLVIATAATAYILLPSTAAAQSDAINDACRNTPNSPVCQDLQDEVDPVSGDGSLFRQVFNVLSFIAGVIAVIIIVIGGIQMMTADGDPQKFTNARNLLIYAVIGILIVLFAQAIVQLVVFTLIE